MEEFIQMLKSVRPDVDFDNETALIEDGLLESFDIVAILAAISDNYDVEIDITEIGPENFSSATTIWSLIQDKLK